MLQLMRITREDSTDLGFVRYCWTFGAVDHDDISAWASRAIDEEVDPPTFLYDMLDVRNIRGDQLDREIGFIAGFGDDSEAAFDYIHQIAVRRGLTPFNHRDKAKHSEVSQERKANIDALFLHNFGIDVATLPRI